MIILIGPHRSGTSITTKILQEHIGEFPFEVSRHSEPVELVDIHTRFLKRNGKEFIDRLYFPELNPDRELISDLVSFFDKWHETDCVIKEPVLSITLNWLPVYKYFKTVFVSRTEVEMAESLTQRKKLAFEDMLQAARWYYDSFNKIILDCDNPNKISFVKDTELMCRQMKKTISSLGLGWDQEIFNKHWNLSEVGMYEKR